MCRKRKLKVPQRPCVWQVDQEWWCAIKNQHGGYRHPLGHGRTAAEALKHWQKLREAYNSKVEIGE